MDGHAGPEGGDLLGEFLPGFGAEASSPFGEGRLRGSVEPPACLCIQALGMAHGRQAGSMQDLIGVGIADAAKKPRVTECPLQGVIAFAKLTVELGKAHRERLDTPWVFAAEFGAVGEES